MKPMISLITMDINKKLIRIIIQSTGLFFIVFTSLSCANNYMRPMHSFNNTLFNNSESYKEPDLGIEFLIAIGNRDGRDVIQMIEIRSRQRIPLPGINRSDSQPINLSISGNSEKIAFIRQRSGETELMVYNRRNNSLRRLEIIPKGVPHNLSMDGLGRFLAVQISREGKWDIDIFKLED